MLKLKIHQGVVGRQKEAWRIMPIDLMYLIEPPEFPIIDKLFNYYYFFSMAPVVSNTIQGTLAKDLVRFTKIPVRTRARNLNKTHNTEEIETLKTIALNPTLTVIVPTRKVYVFTATDAVNKYAKLNYLASTALSSYSIQALTSPVQAQLKTPKGIISEVCILCAKYLDSLNGKCLPYTQNCIRQAEISWTETGPVEGTPCLK